MIKFLTIVGVAFCTMSAPVFAASITWTVKNATFADGGKLLGGFDWDTVTDTISNITIKTTDGVTSTIKGQDYASSTGRLDLVNSPDRILFDLPSIRLTLFGNFDLDKPGTLILAGTRHDGFKECFGCNPVRSGTEGGFLMSEPSPIPLPASLPILAGALGTLGVIRRRKSRNG